MSDISIPGVSSKFETEKIIERLMEVERAPLERMESQLDLYKNQKTYWQEINRTLTRVRDSARELYSFQNPFINRKAISSDTSILTATADRTAVEEKRSIKVLQVAQADRFLSSSLSREYRIPEGQYGFKVGERELSVNFKGGNLTEFADLINRRGRDLVSARIIRDTERSQVLMIESLKPGTDNRLEFTQASVNLALDLGIIKRNLQEERSVVPSRQNIQAWSKPITEQYLEFSEGKTLIKPFGEMVIPLSPPVNGDSTLTLEITFQLKRLPDESGEASKPPEALELPKGGEIIFEGIRIENAPSQVELPRWSPPPPKPKTEDFTIFYASDGRTVNPLQRVSDTEEVQSIQIPVQHLGGALAAVHVRNNNTFREVEVHSLKIFDPLARGDFLPGNPVSTAQDSLLEIDGIEIQRKSNIIDDLIPGVTLTLFNPGEKNVELSIEPDRELIKERIINFVGHYNRLLAEINILTNRDERVIQEITYLTDEEVEKSYEKLGAFQGDMTLSQMKTRLQSLMMNPYTTSSGRDLSLLAQVGVSTNASSGTGSGYDATRLRGYLEINEELLDRVLKENLTGVREIFGFDSDSDLVIDSGVAFALDNYTKGFVETGGVISYKIRGLDTQITSSNRQIASFQDKLVQKEQDLRRQYGVMEGALNSLERSSQAIQNFSTQNSNR